MKLVWALFSWLAVVANSAVAEDVSDVLANISCPNRLPTPTAFSRDPAFGEQWQVLLPSAAQGLGGSPVLWVPLSVTVVTKSGVSGPRFLMRGVGFKSGTGPNLNKDIANVEASFLPHHAVPVYPAATVDCIVKALSRSLFAERKASAEDRALLAAVVGRLNELKAFIPQKIEEIPNTELLARVETLESQLGATQSELKQIRARMVWVP
ncbi:hypothetical protein [Rhizobium sp. Kim5]|uniref:hypothetical protein n=1 Tax=Rhizobium sp. Kim5 TaxID=2020311 RepID=UPI0001904856|nr:hypothetical protein [Rhizobium sp. Kim5]